MLEELAAALGVKKGVIVAGMVGSAVAMLIGPKRHWVHRLSTFVVGFAAAVFLTGPLLVYLKADSLQYGAGLGFMIGLFGMTIADKMLHIIQELNLQTIAGWFRRGP